MTDVQRRLKILLTNGPFDEAPEEIHQLACIFHFSPVTTALLNLLKSGNLCFVLQHYIELDHIPPDSLILVTAQNEAGDFYTSLTCNGSLVLTGDPRNARHRAMRGLANAVERKVHELLSFVGFGRGMQDLTG